MHIDEFLDNPSFSRSKFDGDIHYAKFVLNYFRMPAWMQCEFKPFMKDNLLFCIYQSKQYRCIGASRMGDVWLTSKFENENGYEHRVDFNDCSEWSKQP